MIIQNFAIERRLTVFVKLLSVRLSSAPYTIKCNKVKHVSMIFRINGRIFVISMMRDSNVLINQNIFNIAVKSAKGRFQNRCSVHLHIFGPI